MALQAPAVVARPRLGYPKVAMSPTIRQSTTASDRGAGGALFGSSNHTREVSRIVCLIQPGTQVGQSVRVRIWEISHR
jgi:hypothetical protein